MLKFNVAFNDVNDEFKDLAKNSELKNKHEFNKEETLNLFGMQIQAAATIFAMNMKRIMKLQKREEKNQA